MFDKMLKIAVCCLFTLSVSYNGNASPVEPDELVLNDSGSPHPTLMPPLDLEQLQFSPDQAPSPLPTPTESIETGEESADFPSPKPEKKRTLVKKQSTKSSKKITPRKEEEPNLSKDMKVEPASDSANILDSFSGFYLRPRAVAKNSEALLFAPEELLPVHILLALRADEMTKPNEIHPIVYIPSLNMFIGFKGMLYGLKDELKKALKYDEFIQMKNLENALHLLCVRTEEDLKKLRNKNDMKVAEILISETQKQQWYETRKKVKRDDREERRDPNTLATMQKDQIKGTVANIATYKIMFQEKHDEKLFVPEPPSKDKKKKKSSKDKKKEKSSEIGEENPLGLQFNLSVTKEEEQKASSSSTPGRKGSDAKTPIKRTKSIKKGDSQIATSSAPTQIEADLQQPITNASTGEIPPLPEETLGIEETGMESSSAPLEKGE
ncbi:MAG: hypothetical protein J0H12_04745 [Candidatus Paracaedimonas acanthamoebae]|uniref:Uncharacterized protein n=1 Tax=Candidatus Paracaedimonas acanthamoebae TaxID=244581 RepID=A0A8J7PSZ1_9PROT|nr:hypothetical protein [Candidatus Paracaedimonas acanthamoebae]